MEKLHWDNLNVPHNAKRQEVLFEDDNYIIKRI